MQEDIRNLEKEDYINKEASSLDAEESIEAGDQDELITEEFSLNMGPQHPSTHGVFRAVLTIDGEYVVKEENKIGYLHRGIEKLAEDRTYPQITPYTDRLDYVSATLNNLGYVLAVEKLMDVEIPERADHIRVITAELQRISSHLVFLGSAAIDLNAVTGWMYAFTPREKVLENLEMITGSRMTTSYMRIGGVAKDLPEEFFKGFSKFLDEMKWRIDEFEALILGNEIYKGRTKNIAVIDAETALEYGVTGPNLRAAGVKFDLRKIKPYSAYGKFDFDIITGKTGDSYDRVQIRINEIRQSLSIIKQAVESIPEGPVMAKVPKIIKPPKGEAYHQIEGSKGLLGFYVVSDGTNKPYRLHIHGPSFVNVGVIPKIAKGLTVQDFVTLLATIDFLMGEVDR